MSQKHPGIASICFINCSDYTGDLLQKQSLLQLFVIHVIENKDKRSLLRDL